MAQVLEYLPSSQVQGTEFKSPVPQKKRKGEQVDIDLVWHCHWQQTPVREVNIDSNIWKILFAAREVGMEIIASFLVAMFECLYL
jgi:hypothetical protein